MSPPLPPPPDSDTSVPTVATLPPPFKLKRKYDEVVGALGGQSTRYLVDVFKQLYLDIPEKPDPWNKLVKVMQTAATSARTADTGCLDHCVNYLLPDPSKTPLLTRAALNTSTPDTLHSAPKILSPDTLTPTSQNTSSSDLLANPPAPQTLSGASNPPCVVIYAHIISTHCFLHLRSPDATDELATSATDALRTDFSTASGQVPPSVVPPARWLPQRTTPLPTTRANIRQRSSSGTNLWCSEPPPTPLAPPRRPCSSPCRWLCIKLGKPCSLSRMRSAFLLSQILYSLTHGHTTRLSLTTILKVNVPRIQFLTDCFLCCS
ncbi:hypothetical protein B0H11DRAFT_2270360 [Mycena galericulata]|nr:hypothetical protein B0H11DRAFT_2270360 [Mycena galericulata]